MNERISERSEDNAWLPPQDESRAGSAQQSDVPLVSAEVLRPGQMEPQPASTAAGQPGAQVFFGGVGELPKGASPRWRLIRGVLTGVLASSIVYAVSAWLWEALQMLFAMAAFFPAFFLGFFLGEAKFVFRLVRKMRGR